MDGTLMLVGLFSSGVLLATIFWFPRLRRQKTACAELRRRLRSAKSCEVELKHVQEGILRLGIRHLPPARRAKNAREGIRALDDAYTAWSQELKHLHKRLVSSLHAQHREQRTAKKLRERVGQLELLLMDDSSADLRAQVASLTRERDRLRQRTFELTQVLSNGDVNTANRMLALARQNESLKSELRGARRLTRALERHIHVLEREGAENTGVNIHRLLEYDLPPGSFESYSGRPLEDPEEFVTGAFQSLDN